MQASAGLDKFQSDRKPSRKARARAPAGQRWRRAAGATAGLTLSLFFALYATALGKEGRFMFAAGLAGLSLILAGATAVKVVPGLARSALKRRVFRMEYAFTREGIIYLLVITFISIAALNTGNNLLFIILAILLAGILISGLLSNIVLSGLDLDLRLPEHIFAGENTAARLTIRNSKRLFATYSVTVDSFHKKKRWIRRQEALPNPGGHILTRSVYAPYIPRQSSVTQPVALKLPRRGRYRQESFWISSKFPFGVLLRKRAFPASQEILALPGIQPTRELHEIIPLIQGELASLQKGQGDDLYSIRNYQEGESTRYIDWKSSARTLAIKVREFTREEEPRLTLIFDSQITEATSETLKGFEKAVSLCACIAWHAFETGIHLQFIAEDIEIPMSAAAEVIYPVLEALALLEPGVRVESKEGGFPRLFSSSVKGFPVIFADAAETLCSKDSGVHAYFISFDSF